MLCKVQQIVSFYFYEDLHLWLQIITFYKYKTVARKALVVNNASVTGYITTEGEIWVN